MPPKSATLNKSTFKNLGKDRAKDLADEATNPNRKKLGKSKSSIRSDNNANNQPAQNDNNANRPYLQNNNVNDQPVQNDNNRNRQPLRNNNNANDQPEGRAIQPLRIKASLFTRDVPEKLMSNSDFNDSYNGYLLEYLKFRDNPEGSLRLRIKLAKFYNFNNMLLTAINLFFESGNNAVSPIYRWLKNNRERIIHEIDIARSTPEFLELIPNAELKYQILFTNIQIIFQNDSIFTRALNHFAANRKIYITTTFIMTLGVVCVGTVLTGGGLGAVAATLAGTSTSLAFSGTLIYKMFKRIFKDSRNDNQQNTNDSPAIKLDNLLDGPELDRVFENQRSESVQRVACGFNNAIDFLERGDRANAMLALESLIESYENMKAKGYYEEQEIISLDEQINLVKNMMAENERAIKIDAALNEKIANAISSYDKCILILDSNCENLIELTQEAFSLFVILLKNAALPLYAQENFFSKWDELVKRVHSYYQEKTSELIRKAEPDFEGLIILSKKMVIFYGNLIKVKDIEWVAGRQQDYLNKSQAIISFLNGYNEELYRQDEVKKISAILANDLYRTFELKLINAELKNFRQKNVQSLLHLLSASNEQYQKCLGQESLSDEMHTYLNQALVKIANKKIEFAEKLYDLSKSKFKYLCIDNLTDNNMLSEAIFFLVSTEKLTNEILDSSQLSIQKQKQFRKRVEELNKVKLDVAKAYDEALQEARSKNFPQKSVVDLINLLKEAERQYQKCLGQESLSDEMHTYLNQALVNIANKKIELAEKLYDLSKPKLKAVSNPKLSDSNDLATANFFLVTTKQLFKEVLKLKELSSEKREQFKERLGDLNQAQKIIYPNNPNRQAFLLPQNNRNNNNNHYFGRNNDNAGPGFG